MKNQPYEGSPADTRRDKKMAKKRGVTMKAWEGSKADEEQDEKYSRRRKERPDAQPKFDRVAKGYVS